MKQLERFEDTAYALLRIMTGFMFSFHGMQKMFGVLSQHPQPPVGSQIWIGGVLELVCGLLVLAGVRTRWAAFLASGEMAVAYVQFHWKFQLGSQFLPGVNQGELAVLYCFIFLLIACRGGGKWSLDKKGSRRSPCRAPSIAMITLILDGYNVTHAVPELARHLDRSLQAAREELVRLCQAYRARRGDIGKLYVVFDGRDADAPVAHARQGGVTVLFTRKPEEADQRILRVIEAEGRRARCVVVSNDNEVCNNARAFGAGILSAQAFYLKARPLHAPRAQPPTSSDGQPTLSTRDAQQITAAYRKHLEDRTSNR